LVFERFLFQERQDQREESVYDSAVVSDAPIRGNREDVTRRESALGFEVTMHREADLAEIIRALRSASGLPGELECRQKERDEYGNDADHHQQLNQRECTSRQGNATHSSWYFFLVRKALTLIHSLNKIA
jgi:hypothetical protein